VKKTFDCVAMKRKAQERIREETKGLSREEEFACFHDAARAFREDIESLRQTIRTESEPVKHPSE